MPRKVVMPNETIMYSVDSETKVVVTHHLPWESTSPQLEHYVKKGFTFERPVSGEGEAVSTPPPPPPKKHRRKKAKA